MLLPYHHLRCSTKIGFGGVNLLRTPETVRKNYYFAYFIVQPYWRVTGTETGLPALISVSACLT